MHLLVLLFSEIFNQTEGDTATMCADCAPYDVGKATCYLLGCITLYFYLTHLGITFQPIDNTDSSAPCLFRVQAPQKGLLLLILVG